jgi:glycosyltransferase involved in cell wall biosynthesis
MRVCLVYDCMYPHTVGGAERWYRGLAQRLCAEGHDVTYLTLRQWERGQSADIDSRVRVVTAGPRMALYGPGGRRRTLPPLVFGLGVLWHLLRHGRRYDVVHTASFPYFSVLAAAAARPLADFGLVVDWFEVWSEAYWRDYLGGLAGRVGAIVQRACARVPQRAICFSALHAARLREEGLRGSITVLRGLYDGGSTPMQAPEQPPVAMFAARLIPEKQVTLAVRAVARAAARVDGLRGLFFGDGPQRKQLDEAIADSGLDGQIAALGFAGAEQIEQQMGTATCILVTSRREGYGLVVVEAAARGTPSVVVAGEDNAATELIEDGVNGLVARSADAETVAEAIVRVHEAGAAMRDSTASWYAQHADELSLERSLERVLALYEVEGGGGSRSDRAAAMRALLTHPGHHGGGAAEQAKSSRPEP